MLYGDVGLLCVELGGVLDQAVHSRPETVRCKKANMTRISDVERRRVKAPRYVACVITRGARVL